MSHPIPSEQILSQDLAAMAEASPEAPRLDPSDADALAATLSYTPAELPAGAWEELESKLRAEDEAPRVSLSCTYCHDGLETRGAVAYCASCLAPHHLDCFEEHARCSAPGCAETRWVQPQSVGQPPAPAMAAKAKPELRVLPSQSPAETVPRAPAPRARRVAIFAAAAAASFLGVSVAAFTFSDPPPDAFMGTDGGKGTYLVFERTIPAGTLLTSDDVMKKEFHKESVKSIEESDSPLITESKLSGFLGRRLDRRVLAGEFIRVRQFRAPDRLPVGATLEAYVFTHDVQAGDVLSEEDFERREVAWKMVWEAPDQGLIPDTQARAYVGRRLTSRGKGGEPVRLSHFVANPLLSEAGSGDVLRKADLEFASETEGSSSRTFEALVFKHDLAPGTRLKEQHLVRGRIHWREHWGSEGEGLLHEEVIKRKFGAVLPRGAQGGVPVREPHFPEVTLANRWSSGIPIPREVSEAEFVLARNLSPRGRSLLQKARPVDRARAYLLGQEIARESDLYRVGVAISPELTAYAWLVTFANEEGRVFRVAVSESGRTWELNAELEAVGPVELLDEGSLPQDRGRLPDSLDPSDPPDPRGSER